MRKDAKIALCVILALMVLVVVIWGRTQRGQEVGSDGSPRSQAKLAEDDPGDSAVDPDAGPLPAGDSSAIYEPPSATPDVSAFDPDPDVAHEGDGFTSPRMRTGMINHFGPLTDEERAEREADEPEDDPEPVYVERRTEGPSLDDAMLGRPGTSMADPRVDVAPPPGPTIRHTIDRGDTYQALARKHYGSAGKWRIIYEANGIPPQKLAIGKEILIPSLPNATPAPADSTRVERPIAPTGRTYEVKKGDNFYNIARVVYRDGNKWKTLYEANKSKLRKPGDPGSLRPGIVLDVPTLASTN